MSYHVNVFPAETRARHRRSEDEAFFETPGKLGSLSQAEKDKLVAQLEMVGFVSAQSDGSTLQFENEMIGASALLTNAGLYLSANGQEAIFEILMLASEWCDDSESFAKFDPQEGSWD